MRIRKFTHLNGRKYGVEIEYSACGKIYIISEWLNGKQHGNMIYYKSSGEIDYKRIWINNQLCRGIEFYNK